MSKKTREIEEVAAAPADALYMVTTDGFWWNRGGRGYGNDPGAAELWTRDRVIQQMRASPERNDIAVRADGYIWGDARLADQAFRIWRGRGPTVHTLKTLPEPFAAVAAGAKRAEMRRDDRGFEAGDLLVLREFDPSRACDCFTPNSREAEQIADDFLGRTHVHRSEYSGRRVEAIITHVLKDRQFGIEKGFAMLSILPFKATE